MDKKLDTMYNKIYKLNKLTYISISDDYEKIYYNFNIINEFDLKKNLIFDDEINKNLKRNSYIIFNYSCYNSNIKKSNTCYIKIRIR